MKKSYAITIILWLVVIGATITARDLIFQDVQNSTNIIETNTESGQASDFIKQRFNLNGSDLTHIVVIEVPKGQDVTSNQWRNYTLFLSLYLLDELKPYGYDYVISDALIIANPDIPNSYADRFVSPDHMYSLINIIDPNFDFNNPGTKLSDDVEIIRELLTNTTAPYQTASDQFVQMYGQSGGQVALNNTLPPMNEAKNVRLILTGQAANFADITQTGKDSFQNSEVLAVVLALIILTLVFKSPMGVLMPIVGMVAALFPSYYIVAWMGKFDLFAITDFLPSVIAMIGIAVAIDYNLFSMIRYREEFRKEKAHHLSEGTWDKETMKKVRRDAAERTDKTTGVAVMYSGFTVIIGFLSLLILQSDFTLGMAIGVSIVVFISILVTRTFTKAVLGLFGNFLDWPNFMSGQNKDIKKIQEGTSETKGIWVTWAKLVMKYSIPFLIIGIILIVPFATLSTQVDLSFDLVKNMPPGVESRDGFEILQKEFNLGDVNPYKVVIDLGKGTDLFAPQFNATASKIIDRINELGQWALNYSGFRKKSSTEISFERVSTISVLPDGGNFTFLNYSDIMTILSLPAQIPVIINGSVVGTVNNTQTSNYLSFTSSFINLNNGNDTIVVEMSSNLDPGSATAWELVKTIRENVGRIFKGLIDDGIVKKTYVTGYAASFYDSRERMYQNVPLMLTVATILIFLALLILFRSVILPLKSILTIVGSILFAMGALVFVFQEGNFNHLEIFGVVLFNAEISGISYFLPTFLFTTLLGLGMDYSILIISRIKEEYLKSGDMDEAVAHGINHTAGVISSAAIIMISTFLVFALSPMLTLKTMGVAMAVAVFIDATVSRIILLPSAMKLAGRWNWWIPKWLEKILPDLHLEH